MSANTDAEATPLVRADRGAPPGAILSADRGGPGRPRLEHFVQRAFFAAYGAHVRAFSPLLVGFEGADGLQAVAGLRSAAVGALFSEQYLDAPVQDHIADATGIDADRDRIVEVGNLALAEPGHARWVIGAVTLMLHAAGYRHVVFTAVRPLVNAFARLGLSPVVLGEADRRRLPDGGRRWGRYYESRPVVCAGDIAAGHHHLQRRIAQASPAWTRFWDEAAVTGARLRVPAAGGLALAL